MLLVDARAVVPPPHVAQPLRLLPFRGLTVDPARIGVPSSMRLFGRPYRRAAERLDRWERRGLVHRDPVPAIYLHEYTSVGLTVRGLTGALDLSRRAGSRAEVAVLPHEGVHPRQVDDLATRMEQLQVNPAPILLVYRGSTAGRALLDDVQRTPPSRELVDRGGQRHRLWALRDREIVAGVQEELAARRALIADGHHRYAAYLQLQARDPRPAARAGLAMLVDQDATPLHLGPIHRHLAGTDLQALRATAVRVGVEVRESDAGAAISALRPDTLVATDGRRWVTLRLPLPPEELAVQVLHDRILASLRPAPLVDYHHSTDEALAAVAGRGGTAVLMPAPDFGRVLEICAADRLLPEKATSFQPKPHVGVLIRSLRDG